MSKRRPSKREVHTVPNPNGKGWANELNGLVVSVSRTKVEAVKLGRVMAKREKREHVIHLRDGRIRTKNSYGHDPRNVRG